MEEAHKAVLKRKRVHDGDDEIIPVPDEIRDRNILHIMTHMTPYDSYDSTMIPYDFL